MDGCTSNGKKENCPDGLSDDDSCDSSDDDSSDKGYTNRGDFCRCSGSYKREMNFKKKIGFVSAYFTEFSNLIYTNRGLPALSTQGILRFPISNFVMKYKYKIQ